MVEVDWQGLFNSFFSSVRVKIQCKDPTKVPKKRIFVFKDKLYLLCFTTEGFDQLDHSFVGGSKKGDSDEEKKEEEIQDGNLEDAGKGEGESKGNGEDKDHGQSSRRPEGSYSAPTGSRVAKRMLQFDDIELGNQAITMECSLLIFLNNYWTILQAHRTIV